MTEKVLRILEYNKIITLLEEKATSSPGKAKCRALKPSIDLKAINKAQLETADALALLFEKGSLSFSGNSDLSYCFRMLAVGSTLSQTELLRIADMLECTKRVTRYCKVEREKERNPLHTSLSEYFEAISPLSSLLEEIRRCIISEEEMSDLASTTLHNIRKKMASSNDRIHTLLSKLLTGSYSSYLQDAVITMRNNRYCIPIKAEYKTQVPGMIHDQSSSGSTFFIEPAGVVALNNELKELLLAEKEEIERILEDLSMKAATELSFLETNANMLTILDFIFAKASLAMEQNATLPIFNHTHQIVLRKGRHPLIPKKTVVPIDIQLGKDFDLLIITGPNTGGKTVSLKTVGLLTLMGQAGLHIPAADNSSLSCFSNVFADIGDEQSIEQNLSTFSSHMTNIVQILQHADENSLCLFDELGAGTDPTEGAALAISILTHLHKQKICTMATTHYSELKLFALSTDNVENACCEFDVATLRPTYRLLVGIPGKSNAFAISGKLGLPETIIQDAKELISEDNKSFEDVITDLETSRITIEKEQQEITAYKDRIKTLESQLQNKKERIEQNKERVLNAAKNEARDLLSDAKAAYDEAILALQNTTATETIRELEKRRESLRKEIKKADSTLSNFSSKPKEIHSKSFSVSPGDRVKIRSMGIEGTVIGKPNAKGMVTVQCGILNSTVSQTDLQLLQETLPVSSPKKASYQSGSSSLSKASNISSEINLLGKRVDEALSILEKYLDDAYLSHLPTVRIVHGKGTGALRQATNELLHRTKYVKSYRLAEYGEGDAGVTIVNFK
jgi:DNA mismatch repair protein MutS2